MIRNRIGDLKPEVQRRFNQAWQAMCADEKLKDMGVETVAINETLRELSTQMAYFACGRMEYKYVRQLYAAAGLYDIGEAEARKIKTNTLRSNHIDGKAADFVPVKNGRLWWDAPRKVWETMGEIGEANGLKWGGRWQDFPDSPHFEV